MDGSGRSTSGFLARFTLLQRFPTAPVRLESLTYRMRWNCSRNRRRQRSVNPGNRRRLTKCDAAGVEAEFAEEWRRLGEYLQQHGGLERAVEACFRQTGEAQFARRSDSFLAARKNIRRVQQHGRADQPPAE